MKLARKVLAAALSLAWFPASANVPVHVRVATQRAHHQRVVSLTKKRNPAGSLQSSHP